ncbi:N-6 DNA Methylase N-terminal domain protein (plasmid) [Candidatus Trichorickettsia mobilis]|uniref:N-6 DNA methylase n=1 Tax=Candidatus Trichorickettsia mobilis TaxID=1346319 RepID=UPI002B25D95A|nr:N-6 DNA methylase [Candidatus Trichorickettsia mobilis]WPY01854.1 N-6 DNA Methylase N-terminal domain protein [Candidatus Trichorickettsia mobilis]
MENKIKTVCEYGDFQTPLILAEQAISILNKLNLEPSSIVEPTCGKGSFLMASLRAFPHYKNALGIDINQVYTNELIEKIKDPRINIISANFFTYNWKDAIKSLPEPILIVGNPPWITSSELGILRSSNHPQKSNFQGMKGLEALTGKGNFDISEWMLLQYIDWLQKRKGLIAVLCKTTIARKVLIHAWKYGINIGHTRIYKINALKYFNAAVDACFFIVDCTTNICKEKGCDVYETLDDEFPSNTIGYHSNMLISNVMLFNKNKEFIGLDPYYSWRSGVKHDCSKIMELERIDHNYINGNNEIVELEETKIFPLYKSSDINKEHLRLRKYVLVTQIYVGEETEKIKKYAPKTWKYLMSHADKLDKRGSSIYRNKPRFSIFGIGNYSFYPWKVAISGFYKNLKFKVISPIGGKPAMVDDTVYFLGCSSEQEALTLERVLNSDITLNILNSMIFWDNKRPITIELLKWVNISKIYQAILEAEK